MIYQTSHNSATSADQPPLYQFTPEYSLVWEKPFVLICSYFLPLFSRLKAYKDMTDAPSKLQIRFEFTGSFKSRCIHITLNSFITTNNDNFGLVNAIVSSVTLLSVSKCRFLCIKIG